MTKHIYRADLEQRPPSPTDQPQGSSFTFGDLHGNTIKLIYTLILQGAITATEAQYNELYRLYTAINTDDYENADASRTRFAQFQTALNALEFHNTGNFFRLIGDTLADRGANDYLTLLVLQKLRQNNIPYEINLSNHDMEFITWAETKGQNRWPKIYSFQKPSLENLKLCIRKGILTKEKILQLYHQTISPYLRLHSMDTAGTARYSHAPTLLQSVFHAAYALHIKVNFSMRQATLPKLRWLMAAINAELTKYARAGTLTHKNAPADAERLAYLNAELGILHGPEHPIMHATWNRGFHGQEYRRSRAIESILGLVNTHGHIGTNLIRFLTDRSSEVTTSHCNLDTQLGKAVGDPKGTLYIWISEYHPGAEVEYEFESHDITQAKTINRRWGTAAISLGAIGIASGATALGLALATTLMVATAATGIGACVVLLAAATCALIWLIKSCKTRGQAHAERAVYRKVERQLDNQIRFLEADCLRDLSVKKRRQPPRARAAATAEATALTSP